MNRVWDETAHNNVWKDWEFKAWAQEGGATYIDDDVLGFMTAEAAAEEGQSGSAKVRRAVLEVTRAVSLTPWSGDVTFNAASPGATPSAQKKGVNPVPYGTEVHATRYQFGLALTPERLRDRSRAAKALSAIGELSTVAGNQGRFLYDFSPDSIVIRVTDDPAPRLLYCFETDDDGKTVVAPSLFRRIEGGDIDATELIVGGVYAAHPATQQLSTKGAKVYPNGVKSAISEAVGRINGALNVEE